MKSSRMLLLEDRPIFRSLKAESASTLTTDSPHTYMYIHIYIYVCVCVCLCVKRSHWTSYLGGPDTDLSQYESAFRGFFFGPSRQISPTCLLIVQPLSVTEQSTPHAVCCIVHTPTLNTIDHHQPLQTSCCLPSTLFSTIIWSSKKPGNRCVVSHCCSSSLRFAAGLIISYYLTFCLVMDYPHSCKTRAACIDNSSHAYFIWSWHVVR